VAAGLDSPVATRGAEVSRSAEIEGNSTTKGEGSAMTLKGKRNETLQHDASPIQPHAEDTSANAGPSQEEIRRRAYEIYLERDGQPGDELERYPD